MRIHLALLLLLVAPAFSQQPPLAPRHRRVVAPRFGRPHAPPNQPKSLRHLPDLHRAAPHPVARRVLPRVPSVVHYPRPRPVVHHNRPMAFRAARPVQPSVRAALSKMKWRRSPVKGRF